MNIREFLDRVEEAALKNIDKVQDSLDVYVAKVRVRRIKEQSKGRRHKSHKQLRR